ncbi:zinc-binding dehydrogenase [Actinomadura sp. ATCC 31491]|uniref:Zinc-binding dehydrogenase n=1 Tax=Actinomadura luzonensis TaxID=2805427 RepID=A0ABT0G8R2_9ACTN|nr:zinc-binding dehydrogenase [Actinomadura luzonensis]MCK2220990.1 zinc-binding dehydrogenase [Actinomadura luzonensis]
MTQKILVTGATGTVGRALVTELMTGRMAGETAPEVLALVRDPATAALPADVELVWGDLSDPASFAPAVKGVTAAFLLWPFADAGGFADVLDVIARDARRLVYLSSAALRPAEREVERLIRRSGREWVFLRPHQFAAAALRWADEPRFRAEGVVAEPYGQAALPPVHERDLAEIAADALTGRGPAAVVHELTGPETLTQAEQARLVGEAIGRPVRWEEVPPQEGRRRLVAGGLPPTVADDVLQARARLVAEPWPVSPRPGARPFRVWAAEHAHRFRATMRAARIHEYGDPSVIRHDEVPIPVPGPGMVLIKVAGTAFGPSELGLRSGLLRTTAPELADLPLPHTLGWDVSGTVVESGPGVTWPRPGDRVIGLLDGGAAAEYALAPARSLARAPGSVPLADAAAIPVSGLTAWQAVHEHAHVRRGQRVLVNGAGGGVGMFAVQFARLAGAHVIATAGDERSAAASRARGADEIVRYPADELPGGLDVLLNLVPLAPGAAADLARLVRPGGVLVSVTVPVAAPAGSGVTATRFVTRNDPAQLAMIAALADAGDLVVDVAARRPLEELADVHRAAESGRTRGKIILSVGRDLPEDTR